jgi:hypothetical protein
MNLQDDTAWTKVGPKEVSLNAIRFGSWHMHGVRAINCTEHASGVRISSLQYPYV